MKNKKLFAILTLVCFMFTLMPVAAFAAPADQAVIAKDQPTKDTITTTVDTPETFVVEGNSTTVYYFWAEDEKGNVVALDETRNTTEGVITFDAVGTYYVYAVENGVENSAVTDLLLNDNSTKAEIVAWFKDRHEAKIVGEPMTVKVKKSSSEYTLSITAADLDKVGTADNDNLQAYVPASSTPAAITIVADNGWSNTGEIEVQLKKANSDPVKGEELTFTTNSSYVDVTVEDAETSRTGKVVFNVTASRAGEYKVYVNHPNADKLTLVVYAQATTLGDIKTVAQPAGNVALDTEFYYLSPLAGEDTSKSIGYTGVAFELTSADGTTMKSALNPADYKISIVEAPEDSTLDADDLSLVYDASVNYAYVLKDAADVGSAFDAEGKYVIKVTLKNGKSATATVNVKEFDEPVRMILTYSENTVAYGGAVNMKAVTYLDANGTMLTSTHADYTTYDTVEYAANGKAVKDVFTNYTMLNGAVYNPGSILTYGAAEDGDEYVGTTITAIAVNDELELSATATITVVNAADGLKYQSTAADIAVNNKLIVNPVDENGNVVAAMSTSTSTPSVYVLSAPANAAYSVEADVTDSDELTVTFTASAAGEYKLQTVVRTGDAYLTSVDTIVVGGTTSEFEDVVVMSIGSANVVVNSGVKEIPAAPMIQDGRTFVPFRALAEAFGADVEWVEATQSVVAELNGVKVVMVIGENAYTVDGVAKTADVAPFINGASTMVPVRFVAEAFGINVTPLYAADGSVADVLFAK